MGINYEERGFAVFSQELKGFKSLSTRNEPINSLVFNDLEELFVSLYFIGGGDPHDHNIFYSNEKGYLGSVDLDVSFKKHIRYKHQKMKYFYNPRIQSDLAIRDFNCTHPYKNFLIDTDSERLKKIGWSLYKDNYGTSDMRDIFMDHVGLLNAIENFLKRTPEEFLYIIKNVITEVRKSLVHFQDLDFLDKDYEDHIIGFITERYHTLKCLKVRAFLENSIDVSECEECLENPYSTINMKDKLKEHDEL